jgi:hypothetical protein
MVLALLLLIPLLVSTVTAHIGLDHRFAPIFPVAALTVGIGVIESLRYIPTFGRFKLISSAAVICLAFSALTKDAILFFAHEKASRGMFQADSNMLYFDFMVADIANLAVDATWYEKAERVCIRTSPHLSQRLRSAHYREYLEYRFNGRKFDIRSDARIPEPESRKGSDGDRWVVPPSVFVSHRCVENFGDIPWRREVVCRERTMFRCPTDRGFYSISVQP